ncbi:MAG TPA: choice-of-anchor Q domain-containing protein, partial [Blastocatellia bacterium]|nr:choice-of-anchor Q domain-containing protein [Blastocatellia bacterium]
MTETNTDMKRSMPGKGVSRKLWVLLITALFCVGPLPALRVQAATINVTSTTDLIADDGACTLREAIRNANDTTDGQADNDDCTSGDPAGADIIVLDSTQVYMLSLDMATGDENSTAQEDDLDVKSQITIRGNGATIKRNSTQCDLDGVQEISEFRIFQVHGTGDLTLENVTVENGCAEGSIGGGIVNQGKLSVTDSTISGNQAYSDGGGIFNDANRQMTITRSKISNNLADDDGGGMFNNSGGTVTITGSEIKFNEADFGGGIYNQGTLDIMGNTTISDNHVFNDGGGIYSDSGMLTITDSTVDDNSADGDGGGIYNSADLAIMSSTISNNSADGDGGGIYNPDDDLDITSSTISSNSAEYKGGGIFNDDGSVTIINSTITMNEVEHEDGGGIFNDGGGTLNITGSMISNNMAGQDGGGILNLGTFPQLIDSTISQNKANRDGGGIASNGGYIGLIKNSRISENQADQDNDESGSGGGISNGNGASVEIENSTISLNTAEEGGGIFNFAYNPTTSKMTIKTSTISGNEAGGPGGGLGNAGILTITNSTISGNKTGDADGGGIWNDLWGTVNASFVTIADNDAGTSGQGGGISNDGTVNIKNSIVGNNAGSTEPNCSGTVTASGRNLATDAATMSCGTMNFDYVASTGTGGLNLGVLANNGGPTLTHALGLGSAAIDAVTECTDLQDPPELVMTDQRGVSRPQGSLCDAGAYEAPPPPPPSSN